MSTDSVPGDGASIEKKEVSVHYKTLKAPSSFVVFVISIFLTIVYWQSVALASEVRTLLWDPVTETDLAGYQFYMGTESGNYGSPSDAGNTTQFTVSNLAEGTTYYLAVTAYDLAGNESGPSNEVVVHIADTTPPSVPTGLTAALTSSMDVALSWDASTDNGSIAEYKLYRNNVPLASTGSTLSYLDTSISSGMTYTYTVQAFDGAGNFSSLSDQVSIDIPSSSSFLSVSIVGSGTISSSPSGLLCSSGTCSSSFGTGTMVLLTAQPDKRWKFNGWSGACSGTTECVIQLSGDQSVVATFSKGGKKSEGGKGRGTKGGPKK